jgi:hypothetical protein
MSLAIRRSSSVALAAIGVWFGSAQTASKSHHVVFSKTGFGENFASSALMLNDKPGHKLEQSFRSDRGRSSDPDFDIAQEVIYEQGDESAEGKHWAGYSIYLMRTGDTVYFRWEGATAPPTRNPTANTPVQAGVMQIIRGTGRYHSIQGKGVWQGYEHRPVLEESVWEISY